MPPNMQRNWEKDSTDQNRARSIGMKYKITRMEVDYNSLKLILRQDVKKSKLSFW